MTRTSPRVAVTGTALFGALLLSGCASESPTVIQKPADDARLRTAPSVMATAPRLTKSPTVQQLAAYACSYGATDPTVVRDCLTAFGTPPAYSQLIFQFATTVTVQNRRAVDLPLASVRILLKLLDGTPEQAVGTICLRTCAFDDMKCTGSVAPDGCNSQDAAVMRAAATIERGMPGLIIGPTQETIAIELRKSVVPAGASVKLDLTFDLGLDQMLQVLQPALKARMQNLQKPDLANFSVPVAIEGGVFSWPSPPAGKEQRIGAWFGPVAGQLTF